MKWQSNRKRGISPIISYALLIGISIVVGGIVFQWVRTYVPQETAECPDGVSLIVSSYSYSAASDLNLTLRNRGRFNLDGYLIRASEDIGDLPTIDLSARIAEGQSQGPPVTGGGGIYFSGNSENPLEPGTGRQHVFDVSGIDVKSVQITPFREEVVDNVRRLATCSKAIVIQRIEEGEHFVLSGDGGTGTGAAVLEATASSVSARNAGTNPGCAGGKNWWTFTVTLQETSGVAGNDISLDLRQKCYENPISSDGCDPASSDFSSYGGNQIVAGGQVQSTAEFACSQDQTTSMTQTFTGNSGDATDSYTLALS